MPNRSHPSKPARRARLVALLLLGSLLAGCKAPAADPAGNQAKADGPAAPRSLVSQEWQLASAGEHDASTADAWIYIELDRLQGNTGCNSLGAVVQLEGSAIGFSQLIQTKKMCPAQHQVELALLDGLRAAKRWRIEGETLELLDADGTARLRFEPRQPR